MYGSEQLRDHSYCMRSPGVSACGTTGTGCSGCDATNGCSCGNYPVNMQTCSHCSDSCPLQMNATACHAIPQCSWNSFCSPSMPYSVPCRTNLNKTACLNDAAGCFWMNATELLCGSSIPLAMCTPCNDPTFGSIRSALSHQPLGQACNWPAVAPFTQGAQVTLTDFGTAAAGVGGCTALDPPKSTDFGSISHFLSLMGSISSTSVGTCGGAVASPQVTPATATSEPSPTPSAPTAAVAGKGKNAKGKAKGKGKNAGKVKAQAPSSGGSP